MADVSVDINFSKLEGKLSPRAFKIAQLAVANQVLLDMNHYVPRLHGDLRGSGHAMGDKVVWSTVYARAQFYGTNGRATFNNYSTPGTGKRWDERVPDSTMREWGKVGLRAMGVDL